MGGLSNTLHGCVSEEAEESEEDGKADRLPQGKCSVNGQIGEGKQLPDQLVTDGNDVQGANHNAHADAIIIHQEVWN